MPVILTITGIVRTVIAERQFFPLRFVQPLPSISSNFLFSIVVERLLYFLVCFFGSHKSSGSDPYSRLFSSCPGFHLFVCSKPKFGIGLRSARFGKFQQISTNV
jgi:hypothetical protein